MNSVLKIILIYVNLLWELTKNEAEVMSLYQVKVFSYDRGFLFCNLKICANELQVTYRMFRYVFRGLPSVYKNPEYMFDEGDLQPPWFDRS